MSDFETEIKEKSTTYIFIDGFAAQIGANQDIVVSMSIDVEDKYSTSDVIAVLDGHGPDLVTNIIREEKNLHKYFAMENPAESLQQLIESKIPEKKEISDKNKWLYSSGIPYKKYNYNKVNDKCIFRSGATLSFAKINRNTFTEKLQIILEWLGDSPIFVFKNGDLIFNAELHNANNPSECERLRNMGVLKFVEEGNYGFEIIHDNILKKKQSKYVYFTNDEGFACTRSLGHNRVTGIETQKHIIEANTNDDLKIIVCSDGVGDMININFDMEKLKTFTAHEIINLVENRWKQVWNDGTKKFKLASYDDCSCGVWWQKDNKIY